MNSWHVSTGRLNESIRSQCLSTIDAGVELCALYIKLAVSPLYKRWTWRSMVKPGLKLNPTLTFKLPFKADIQVHASTTSDSLCVFFLDFCRLHTHTPTSFDLLHIRTHTHFRT